MATTEEKNRYDGDEVYNAGGDTNGKGYSFSVWKN